MSFNSLEQLIQKLLLAPELEKQRHYLLVRDCWYKTVNAKIALHTRPLSFDRQILFIATKSAPWAQTLSLQRDRLLKQLNPQLPFTLLDLRFSTVNWQEGEVVTETRTIVAHPSSIVPNPSLESPENPSEARDELPIGKMPSEALERWLATIEARSQSFPLCPCCHTPTPNGELERWGICAYCFALDKSKCH
jgi:predicted nucleic acid-binding Zn ribbon protein